MSNDRTSDEDPRLTTKASEPVPEADALEQVEEVAPDEEDDSPSEEADVPEADAIEQSRVVPVDEDEHP
jgi:hypothetical protein